MNGVTHEYSHINFRELVRGQLSLESFILIAAVREITRPHAVPLGDQSVCEQGSSLFRRLFGSCLLIVQFQLRFRCEIFGLGGGELPPTL